MFPLWKITKLYFFMVWKFFGNAQFPQSFGQISVHFHNTFTAENYAEFWPVCLSIQGLPVFHRDQCKSVKSIEQRGILTTEKMKFSIRRFFSKCDQIRLCI